MCKVLETELTCAHAAAAGVDGGLPELLAHIITTRRGNQLLPALQQLTVLVKTARKEQTWLPALVFKGKSWNSYELLKV